MTQDIVIRLREFNNRAIKVQINSSADLKYRQLLGRICDMNVDAVIEIERLRARVDELRAERAPAP